MRKAVIALIGGLLISTSVYAQNSAVTKADRFLQTERIAEAKEQIDLATVHEKSKGKGRTWFFRGKVYAAIYNSTDPEIQALAEDPFNEALSSFDKVLEMEQENSNYYTLTSLERDGLWNSVINGGVTAYQNDEMLKAITYFDKAKLVRPEDTTAWLFAGICASSANEYDVALENFYELVNLEYSGKRDIYASLIDMEKRVKGDTLKALEVATMAREEFPKDNELRKQEINLLILTNKIEQAQNELDKAIKAEPNNANLLFNMGFLYEELDEGDKAEEYYKKATEADPTYFEAMYNLAVFYYNQAADLLGEARDMEISEYNKRGKEVEDKAIELLKVSLPYFEQSMELRPEEPVIIDTLSKIYTQLGDNEKAEEMLNKLDEIEGGE